MSRVLSFNRLLLGLSAVGALAGMMLALSAREAQAAKGGGYTCASPSSCTAGSYSCSVLCYPAYGCQCTIS